MSLHQMLGGGAAADIFLWVDKKKSILALGLATVIWLYLEIMENRVLPFVSSTLLVMMPILFIWSNLMGPLLKRRPPKPQVITLPEPAFRALFSTTNRLLLNLYEISLGADVKSFLLTNFYLLVIAFFGSYVNFLTLLYICFICLATVPVLYLNYQNIIDDLTEKVLEDKQRLLQAIKSKVLDKIPTAHKASKM